MEPIEPGSEALSELAHLLASRLGLHYPPEKRRDLAHKVLRLSRAIGFSRADDCLNWLISSTGSEEAVQRLISVCTVGETYFFREAEAIDRFIVDALPSLLAAARAERRPLRLWSAGCCTGEEAYTLAMALYDAQYRYGPMAFEVFGTDVNPDFISRARAGTYRPWSFRKAPDSLVSRHFVERGGFQAVRSEIRAYVRFDLVNLSSAVYPGIYGQPRGFDAIFCRNVLMYFTPDAIRNTLRHFQKALRPGGWMVASAVEASLLNQSGLNRKNLPVYAASNGPGPMPSIPDTAPGALATPIQPVILQERAEASHEANFESPPLPTPPESTRAAAVRETEIAAAQRLAHEGRLEAARGLLRESSILESNTDAQLFYARLCYLLGALEEAGEWSRRVLDSDRLSSEAHRILASLHRERGDTDAALRALQRALYINPQSADVHMQIAFLYSNIGKKELSRRHFRNAGTLFGALDGDVSVPELGDLTASRLAEIALSMAEERVAI